MSQTIFYAVMGALALGGLLSFSGPPPALRLDNEDRISCASPEGGNRPRCQASETIGQTNAPFQSCVNLGGGLEANFEGEWGYRIEGRHIEAIAAAGFEAIRLPIRWSAYTQDNAPHTIDPAFFNRIDHIVDHALAQGLYVIINVHHFDGFMGDPDGEYGRLRAIWQQISMRYAGRSERLIFEVLNEPHGRVDADRVNALNADLLGLIRQDNPDRWVVLSAGQWSNIFGLEAVEPPDDPRVMATLHFYEPFDFTHQGAPWTDRRRTGIRWGSRRDQNAVRRELERAADYGSEHAIPVFMGEFGVYRGVPLSARAAWTRYVREQAEDLGLAWCHWDFATTFPIYDQNEEAWETLMLDSLLD